MVFENLHHQLHVLRQVLEHMPPNAFVTPIRHLGMSTIGGHTRHVLEMIDCALKGYTTGEADYTNRVRNLLLETDLQTALDCMSRLTQTLAKPDRPLQVAAENESDHQTIPVSSSYFREISFLTDHTVHHMALIKVGLIELGIPFHESFGIAHATIKYRSSLQS